MVPEVGASQDKSRPLRKRYSVYIIYTYIYIYVCVCNIYINKILNFLRRRDVANQNRIDLGISADFTFYIDGCASAV